MQIEVISEQGVRYLFFSLFNDAFNSSGYVTSNDRTSNK
jgi:hypothetical protein